MQLSLGTPSAGSTAASFASTSILNVEENLPVAVDDNYQVVQGQTIASGPGIDQQGLLDSDFDPAGDVLTLTSVDSHSLSGGSATISLGGNWLTVDSDGGFSFTAARARRRPRIRCPTR